jgi:nickel transport protein
MTFSILVLTLFLLTAPPCWGHGTEGSVSTDSGVLILATYDDGEPMSYAGVEIIGPDSQVPFQKGRTDRNGRFMFFPDSRGRWQVVVKDAMGHRLALAHEEGGGLEQGKSGGIENPAPVPPTEAKPPKIWGIVTGLSIIFGLGGCLWAWTTRQKYKGRSLPGASS